MSDPTEISGEERVEAGEEISVGSGKVHIYASNPGSLEDGAPVELNYYKPIWTKEKK